ncbi:MAG: hypothetical protein AAGF07_03310 [Patescibacteria group bacterium]
MINYLKKIKSWLVLAIAISFIFGFIFIATHQIMRTEANTPLVDTGQNILGYLENDETVDSQLEQLVSQIEQSPKVDVRDSDKVVVSIYNDSGEVQASTASLDEESPTLESEIFGQAKQDGVNKITWAPEDDKEVRLAFIVYPIKEGDKGYLVIGKSLEETEINITKIGKVLLAGWLITLLVTLLSSLVLNGIIDAFDNSNNKSNKEKINTSEKAKSINSDKKTEAVNNKDESTKSKVASVDSQTSTRKKEKTSEPEVVKKTKSKAKDTSTEKPSKKTKKDTK